MAPTEPQHLGSHEETRILRRMLEQATCQVPEKLCK